MRVLIPLLFLSATLHAADFPAIYDSGDQSKPMPAAEAAANMTLPPGFKASVFAAEPDVQNPIAMTWDSRGRLWVAENYTYAGGAQKFDLGLRDRIVIYEDRKGDGHFSSRKIFCDDLQMLTSLEVGRGGVYVMCPPNLLFIPDRNADDIPDGPPEVVLDGFTVPAENYHNFANGLRFGPDGWLYGRVGGSAPGEIGIPGATADQRIPVRGGIWRYQPERRIFETLTAGTTNPWGHDWNSFGELFHVNTVNGHLWHVFAGAHFVRGATVDPNPRVYSLIDMHADHWHFDTGKGWTNSRAGAANELGGGHSHIGAMIYLGDNWPAEFRDHLFTLNQHGRRANQEILERVGSGYVAHRGDDMLFAADPWYVGLDLRSGPDGGVFIIDWNDDGECHGRNGIHRSTGRIYKITYGDPKPADFNDLAKLAPSELVQLHTRPNEWYSRQARIELATRAAGGVDLQGAREELRSLFAKQTDPAQKLRALWSLHVIGGTDTDFLRAQLRNPDEHIRTWAIRLLSDLWPLDTIVSKRPPRFGERTKPGEDFAREAEALQLEFARLAREDSSGLVRLALASTLQRMPTKLRPEIAAGLVSHAEDAADHNLPLLVWYGLIPVADVDPTALAQLASKCQWPLTRQYIARRLAEDIEKNPAPLNALLEHIDGPAGDDIVAGIQEALAGWRKAPKPAAWDAFAARFSSNADPARTARLQDLGAVFGDGRALAEVKNVALDSSAKLEAREAALQTLIDSRVPELREICEKLLGVLHLDTVAARGLATFDDPKIGPELVGSYRSFHQSERPQLLAVLVSRPTFARALLGAIANDKIPRSDVSAFLARQIRNFHEPDLDEKLTEVWGDLHDTAADKQQLMAKLEQQLTPEVLAKADKSAGRAVFAKTCAVCHRLYGEGADIGPDLTGSGRSNLHYLVENIVDPSAVVPVDFRLNIVTLADGRVLNGFITAKTERTVTLKTVTEKLTVERSEIKSLQESPLSLMPEGLLQSLTETQVRDLIGYLMYPGQVALPAGGQ